MTTLSTLRIDKAFGYCLNYVGLIIPLAREQISVLLCQEGE